MTRSSVVNLQQLSRSTTLCRQGVYVGTARVQGTWLYRQRPALQFSFDNTRAVANAGATPFIAFKKNSGPGDFRKEGVAKTQAWSEMYQFFMWKAVGVLGALSQAVERGNDLQHD